MGRRPFLVGAALLALGGARPRTPLALEKLHPAFAALPRAGLWGVEPPIRSADALARALGLRGSLRVVRDDEGGTIFGGGKARKLDLLLGEAIARGATAVATTGGTGSNHARATATAARALGLDCTLALLPEPETAEVTRNLASMKESGAALTVGGRDAVERARRSAGARGALWIPMGGTSPLGNVSYVDAALAFVARQRGATGAPPLPDRVVVALGSTGTAVGIAIGLALAGVSTRVVAVRASSPGTSSRAVVDRGIDETVEHLRRIAPSIAEGVATDAKARLEVDAAELGAGYGIATARGRDAQDLALAHEAIPLEATYGAKALAAVIRRAAAWRDEHVVLWIGSDARWLARRARP